MFAPPLHLENCEASRGKTVQEKGGHFLWSNILSQFSESLLALLALQNMFQLFIQNPTFYCLFG